MTPMLPSVDHPALALLPEHPSRDDIEAFGLQLQALEGGARPDVPTCEIVNPDVYGRGVVIRKDTYLVGLAHKKPGIAICVGDITVWTEKGRQRLTGAHIINTDPGHMRVGFAHADTAWFTVHANHTGGIDPRAIEDSLVETPERLMTRRHPDALGMPGMTEEMLP